MRVSCYADDWNAYKQTDRASCVSLHAGMGINVQIIHALEKCVYTSVQRDIKMYSQDVFIYT